jgi:hypothetical protein
MVESTEKLYNEYLEEQRSATHSIQDLRTPVDNERFNSMGRVENAAHKTKKVSGVNLMEEFDERDNSKDDEKEAEYAEAARSRRIVVSEDVRDMLSSPAADQSPAGIKRKRRAGIMPTRTKRRKQKKADEKGGDDHDTNN